MSPNENARVAPTIMVRGAPLSAYAGITPAVLFWHVFILVWSADGGRNAILPDSP